MGCCGSAPTGPPEKAGTATTKSAAGIGKSVAPTKQEIADRGKLYANNPKIQLGYWKIRGLAHPIRYLLEYIEHPYDDVMYEQGDAPQYSIESWTSVKNKLGLDFPNMPYMIDGDVKITDTIAIMVYLCHKYAPELLGDTPKQKAEVDMLYAQMKDIKSAITGPCYVGINPEQLKQTCKVKMQPIVEYLGKKDYICGENTTYIDFYLLEMCDFVQFLTNNEFYNENKTIARYVKRVKGLR